MSGSARDLPTSVVVPRHAIGTPLPVGRSSAGSYSALGRHVLVEAGRIQVQVKDGVISLSGNVPNWPARRAANNAALHTAGVVDVRNNLTVSP